MSNKEIMTISHADYRGVIIYDNGVTCSIFLAGKQYDFITLPEATAFIDAYYGGYEQVVAKRNIPAK